MQLAALVLRLVLLPLLADAAAAELKTAELTTADVPASAVCLPLPYPARRCLQELDVEPGRCVVVEDSRIGLAAAKAAGMRCACACAYACACGALP